jgi:cytochrome c oxidase subunit I+III
LALGAAAGGSLISCVLFVISLLQSGQNPTLHVYPAMVWTLVGWTVLHLGLGFIMQVYCMARRIFGKMTARYDADIQNVTLYFHFACITALVTWAVVGLFPLTAG